jgi:DNA-binding transcriptional LysR family regulator
MSNPADDDALRIGASGWQSAIEVRQLRVFVAVVDHGSLSAAALALGLAQSTVSEALTALDRALGTPTVLRKRGAHATALTHAGEALLPYARRTLREIDELHLAVAQVTRSAQAHLEVYANESVSTYILGPARGALRRRWPKVRVAVTVASCTEIRGAATSGRADLGILLDEASSADAHLANARASTSGGSLVLLAEDVPLVIFGCPSHPLVRRGGPLRPDMLQPFSLLIADSAGAFHEIVRRYFVADGLPGPQLDSVGSVEAVRRGVDADPTALGLLPHYAVAEDLAKGCVSALTLHPAPPQMRLLAMTSQPVEGGHPLIAELLDEMRRQGVASYRATR